MFWFKLQSADNNAMGELLVKLTTRKLKMSVTMREVEMSLHMKRTNEAFLGFSRRVNCVKI